MDEKDTTQKFWHDIGFSVKTTNCLTSAGIKNAEEIIKIGPQGLLRLPNFGRRCLREVDEFISDPEWDVKMKALSKMYSPAPPGGTRKFVSITSGRYPSAVADDGTAWWLDDNQRWRAFPPLPQREEPTP